MSVECVPDWRWRKITRAMIDFSTPQDPFIQHVYNVNAGNKKDTAVEHAISLHQIPYKRDNLIAFFLSRATHQQITRGTWIPEEVLIIFEKLFIDPTQFSDKMDLRMYAKFYRDHICEMESRPVIEKAIQEGGPYLLLQYWATGNEVIRVPDEELATKLLMTSFTKLAIASQESILAASSKEAVKWGKLANQALAARNRLNPTPLDTEDLIVGIKNREVTTAIGEDGVGFDLSTLVH